MSPRRQRFDSADAARVRPGNEEARFMDHIAASLAATEAAIADLTTNPVVPPRRPAPAPSPLVDRIRQANEAHHQVFATTTPERSTTAMTNKEIRTTADGRKYWHAWNVGDYRVTLTIPWSPTVGQWSVTGPDGTTYPTPVDGRDNKWYVADTKVASLKAAIAAVVARDTANREAIIAQLTPPAEAPEALSPEAEAVRQEVVEAAETAEEAAQVQTLARTTRPSRRQSTNNRSPLAAGTGPKPPARSTLARWARDGVAKATDGCRVEPDGRCEHGQPSWLLELGLI